MIQEDNRHFNKVVRQDPKNIVQLVLQWKDNVAAAPRIEPSSNDAASLDNESEEGGVSSVSVVIPLGGVSEQVRKRWGRSRHIGRALERRVLGTIDSF